MFIFWRPFVKWFTLCYRTVVLSVLSVTLVYCGQMVGWIKMKLGMQVGLSPGHIVLDGDLAPLPKGAQLPTTIFCPYLLRPIDCMDQDATRHRARPRPRQLCVRWGLHPKRGGAPKFSAHVYCGQMAGWIKMVLGMENASSQATLC